MKLIFSILFLIVTGTVKAQTISPAIVNSAGLRGTVNSIEFEFNLGESFTSTIGSAAFITQGLLQPINVAQGPLPVLGLEFNAKRINATTVELQWKTLQEINNKGFWIERKKDNEQNYTAVQFINSLAVNGNASSPVSYSFTDDNNYSGKTFYRLEQVDIDGASEYSTIRMVGGIVNKIIVLKAWPIPSNGTVNVMAEGIEKDVLQLFDMSGKLIQQYNINNASPQQITGLSKGVYVLRLAGKKDIVQKIVVQ